MRRKVSAIVLAFLALGAGEALAQPGGEFFTDPKSRCKLWWPTREPYYSDGKIFGTYTILSVKWNGTCGRGMAQGRNTFEVVEKSAYEGSEPTISTYRGEGDFVDGKLTGRGFYVGTDEKGAGSFRIEGEFRDGVLNGRVIQTGEAGPSKSRFEGTYRDGKLEGWGSNRSENVFDGKRHWFLLEGEYHDDALVRGVQASGQEGCKAEMRYEGEFKDGNYHGRGTLKAYDGKVYTGVFVEGRFGGKSAGFELSSLSKLEAACR